MAVNEKDFLALRGRNTGTRVRVNWKKVLWGSEEKGRMVLQRWAGCHKRWNLKGICSSLEQQHLDKLGGMAVELRDGLTAAHAEQQQL